MRPGGEEIDAGIVADSLLEPVFAVEDGTIRYANRRFTEVFQLDRETVVGADLARFEEYVETGVSAFREAVDVVASGKADERRVELEMAHPPSAAVPRQLPAEARITPVRVDGGRSGVVVALRNISERRAHERELGRRTERLEEFASVVSHDLRNPLSVAQGTVDLVREDHDDERLDRVARAHDRMVELIDELLELARAGGPVSAVQPVALAGLVEDCWATVSTADATLDVETTATVRADPSRLRQLLENLVRNAVVHGGSSVTVTVGDLPDGFFVADDGAGFDPDERERVLDPGVSSIAKGTGLGLAIVDEIAAAHGWSIEVTEARDGGARLEFTGVDRVD